MSKRAKVVVSPEKIKKQSDIIEELKIYNRGKNKKYMITTYGCQMNEHDSETLSGMLENMGYSITTNKEEANLIIYNTCCVRENAELKVYGNIGALKALKKKNEDLIIAVCGCMMQQPQVVKEIKRKYRHVDLVFGTHNLYRFPELLSRSMETEGMFIEVWDEETGIVEGLPANRKYDLKGFINIMYGCNNFCTYCIVPYTRGRERSREVADIIREATDLANNGTKEITLLGQNVNSYGKTLEHPIDFADLLRALNKIDGIERIRFMTSHPKDLSERLIDAIAECDKVCEHFHLPFQSGSNQILKAMNRKYTKENYLSIVKKLKDRIPNIGLTTDIIVGFPGETEEDFQDTLDIVQEARYDSAYTFLYSIREGTPAAKMQNQIDEKVKQERFSRLLDKVNEISAEINQSYLNKVVEVLVEGPSKTDSNKLMGRTRQNKLVNFSGDESLIGKLVNVRIVECRTFSLNGEVIQE
ncbi:tRNA (N6-isopentenyl adenosine(37)-C2)-methylthiotransferase MiaB [Alkaliphilus oremlandii]|uniref:tRNA-2-methylthio-N(6)-dimethylallyladenosine synthase n=1 Tax=Alkaliphilus oremlandii (strain OhILAs) TaxID=350688 RepID=MIAB_ALKOO|nr:tRNA (N6-isopentenyl adenosine(37)-C2)-methylthiotransferase MiaB [Alkaliphilus oremlandii]A8MFD5.1 RecName: Full=tRNA-2-methylthio-N(6)-dimethylallyladenosine synthase; AltName: Full=(Dimethylallyl)adenosine tRNA methylthiotransferase MiaB; AltName: Full=tRNA-i(6)A37 methylthiotransferase [Alkaliphilus oremlandii OhILAs]ABW19098.1 tRNA-i(6)A37 thiotransferase enzyme MiaB [Alkaliphilus oremlandii OhILAs]